MCHICQLKIINLLPDQFTSFYEVIRLYKPVSDWLELLPPDSTGLNM